MTESESNYERTIASRLLSIIVFLVISLDVWNKHGGINDITIINNNYGATNNNSSTTQNDSCTCNTNNTKSNSIPSTSSSASSSSSAAFDKQSPISECCCTFATIESTNFHTIHPLLKRIVDTPFFAHFKIDLCSECNLWKDSHSLCMLRDCGVCECEEPPVWAADVGVDWIMPVMKDEMEKEVDDDDDDDCGHVDDGVVTMVDSHVPESWMSPSSSSSTTGSAHSLFFGDDSEASPLMNQGGGEEDMAVVVDLRLNPERYTGYAGKSAEKVWNAIHQDNCFQQQQQQQGANNTDNANGNGNAGECNTLPTEQRIYNRIISGMHSSISLHIAHTYCLEMDSDRIAECKTWGSNAELAYERVLDHKDRLENLYVVFAIMLRAVQKAGPAIRAAVPLDDPYYAGSLAEWTSHLQPALTDLLETCPPTFDETTLFDGIDVRDVETKRLEVKRRFQHLLQIMQCVGCDRCKLWGTLQALGVGTALRIILDEKTSLERQEAVALVHMLERFSSALVYAHEFQTL